MKCEFSATIPFVLDDYVYTKSKEAEEAAHFKIQIQYEKVPWNTGNNRTKFSPNLTNSWVISLSTFCPFLPPTIVYQQ